MYDREHMLFQWTGEFQSGNNSVPLEIFTGSLRVATTDSPTFPGELAKIDNDDAMEVMRDKLAAFWVKPASGIFGQAVVRSVKWNRIGTDGRYVDQQNTRELDGLTIYGGVSLPRYPTFVACASSYTTAARRGAGSKGRTYWPTAHEVDNVGFGIGATAAGNMANAVWTMISDMGNWPGFDLTSAKPCVMSKQRNGATNAITGVRVGRVLDVVRRRKNAMLENYVSNS